MNAHEQFRENLPFYVSGTLDEKELGALEAHIQTCGECQADLRLWQNTQTVMMQQSDQAQISLSVLDSAIAQIRAEQKQPGGLRRAFELLLIQIPLVRREIWPASAIIMLIGFAASILIEKEFFIQLIAPLVAVWGISALYGPENDPVFELAAATPTSQTQILLARLAAVFSYNLVLALAVSLAAAPVFPIQGLDGLILTWLAPMTFLTSLALLLSLWMSTGNAITIPYLAWLARFILGGLISGPDGNPMVNGIVFNWAQIYVQFWSSPLLQLSLAAILLAGALFSLRWLDHRLPRLV